MKIYNDAYVELIGTKHPKALGCPGREVWPEIWDTIGPFLAGVMERGEATWADDLLLMLERNGYAEECYFTFSYSPIRDESGGIGGIFTPVVETTEKVIGERRLRTLRDIAAARNNRSRNAEEACVKTAHVLAANPYDLPFAAIYLFDGHEHSARLGASATTKEQNIGLPASIDFRTDRWLPCERLMTGETCLLPVRTIGLRQLPIGPWGATIEEAIAVPIQVADDSMPVGFVLAGVSPKKRLNDRSRAFYAQIAEELGNAIREARMAQRESELLAEAEAERAKIGQLFMQAPAAIMMLHGPNHKIVLVNERYVRLLGRTAESDLIGKSLADALPEISEQ